MSSTISSIPTKSLFSVPISAIVSAHVLVELKIVTSTTTLASVPISGSVSALILVDLPKVKSALASTTSSVKQIVGGPLVSTLLNIYVPASVVGSSPTCLPRKSYAKAAGKVSIHMPTGSVPIARKGSYVFNAMNQCVLQDRLNLCQSSLIALVILYCGDTPWKIVNLKQRFYELWGLASWRLIALGKEFFHVLLFSAKDKASVWSRGSVNLRPKVVRLQEWSIDFNSCTQKSINAHVWIRL